MDKLERREIISGFSGKDPSKIDRTGAYMARFVAKNLVANGFVDKCTINVSYEFGEQQPTNLQIITEKGFNASLTNYVRDKFDFRPFAGRSLISIPTRKESYQA